MRVWVNDVVKGFFFFFPPLARAHSYVLYTHLFILLGRRCCRLFFTLPWRAARSLCRGSSYRSCRASPAPPRTASPRRFASRPAPSPPVGDLREKEIDVREKESDIITCRFFSWSALERFYKLYIAVIEMLRYFLYRLGTGSVFCDKFIIRSSKKYCFSITFANKI